MKVKEIIKRILYYVSVPKCVLCKEKLDYEDRGLCKTCKSVYEEHKMRNCPHCSMVLSECNCTYEVLESHGIKNLVKLFRYSKTEQSQPSNYLIYSLKQDNRSDVISFLADELSEALRRIIDPKIEYVITNVPRRRKAKVNFGYDHARVLAREVSKRLGVEYVELLRSMAKKSQKSVYGAERIRNANFDYVSKMDYSLRGKHVILIDDIVTTGASMSNCATLIKGLRPKRIIGACLGVAYREPYIKFDRSAYK